MIRNHSTKENLLHSRVGGLMAGVCREVRMKVMEKHMASTHGICADLSKDPYLTLLPVEEEWVML